MCVTAVQIVPNEGLVATGRIFAGSVNEGDHVFLLKAGKENCVKKVSIYMSAFRERVSSISAGNIAAVAGLESARAGETIVDIAIRHRCFPSR